MDTENTENGSNDISLQELKDVMNEVLPPGYRKPTKPSVQPHGGVLSPFFMHRDVITPKNSYDEVFDGIILGDKKLATDRDGLQKNGITYVVNAAQGKKFNQIDTDAEYFAEIGIQFFGINAIDMPRFKISKHFNNSADFIQNALDQGGKVYVHCQQGLSRSATIVLSYLMLKKSMTLVDAAVAVRKQRPIMPNDGFLQQLIELQNQLDDIQETHRDSCEENEIHSPTSSHNNTLSNDTVGIANESCQDMNTISHLQPPTDDIQAETKVENVVCDNVSDNTEKHLSQDSASNEDNSCSQQLSEGAPQPKECSKDMEKITSTPSTSQSLTVVDLKKVLHSYYPDFKTSEKPNKQKGTLLFINRDFSAVAPVYDVNEVYPGIFIGNEKIARDKQKLKQIGITHIVNTAQGEKFCQIDTTKAYYADIQVEFYGITAMDVPKFKLSKHFEGAANFIDEALQKSGNVLVHCHQGMSRSATVVLAYLIMKRGMCLVDALKMVRKKRAIWPNDGFLAQLIQLQQDLGVSEK